MKIKNNRKYHLKRSSAGLGLFATEGIVKGEFIIEYTGEVISHEEANRRGGRYLFTLNKKTVLDGKGREHIARYINHACNPNAEAIVEDDAHIMIYALKNIIVGEEISYDYGVEYVKDIIQKDGCLCNSCYKK